MDSDAPAILSVDWSEGAVMPPEPVRDAVEYYGTKHAGRYADDSFPDEWKPGAERWGVLTRIIDEHATWNVPGHGPLDSTYAPLISTSGLQDALRAYRGEEDVLDRFPLLVPIDPAATVGATTPAAVPNAGLEIDVSAMEKTSSPTDHPYSFSETDFGGEVHRLVEAAAHLDEEVDSFVDPVPDNDGITGRPGLRTGQYGPDCLGNLYITVCIPPEMDPESLPLEDHPVSVEDTRDLDVVSGTEVILRHERYVEIPWASEPWGERTAMFFTTLAEQADFIEAAAFYWVSEDVDSMVREQTGLVPADEAVEFPPRSGEMVQVYEPPVDGSADEELQWLTILPDREGSKQPIGLFTSAPPTSDTIMTAALLVDVKGAMRSGDARAVYECESCGEWSHWLGTVNAAAEPGEILDRIDHAHAKECGCEWSPAQDSA